MKGLRRSVERFDRDTRRILTGAVSAVENFRSDGSSKTLNQIQDGLRALTFDCEARIRVHRGRRKKRKRRIAPLTKSVSGELIGEHQDWLGRRDAVYARRRTALRQIGDALAWLALRGDMGAVSAVYDAAKSHFLPPLPSLIGHASLIEQITDRTDLLVIDNDLTRILGAGDLTVITPRSRPLRPFVLEIRTHGDIISDPSTTMTIQGVFVEAGADDGVREQLRQALDFKEGPGPLEGSRKQRQLQQIAELTEGLYQLLSSERTPLPAPVPAYFSTIERVLRRSEMTGYAFDIPRDGIAYLAVSQTDGSPVRLEPALQALARFGVDVSDASWGSVVTLSLGAVPELARVLPPVALWRMSPDLRAKLLNEDLILTGYIRRDLWRRSFGSFGWSFLVTQDHGWRVQKDEEVIELGRDAAVHAQLGVAFLGFDPDNVAEAVVQRGGA